VQPPHAFGCAAAFSLRLEAPFPTAFRWQLSRRSPPTFSRANFTPVTGMSSTLANWRVTGLSANNTRRTMGYRICKIQWRISW
jgi:hypothetical protein